MEQLPVWMQYTIMFVLGALVFALCMAAWIRYQDWDAMRKARDRQFDFNRSDLVRIREKVYLLEKLHQKEINRYQSRILKEIGKSECRKEKGQCH